jgi:hypothetical protein
VAIDAAGAEEAVEVRGGDVVQATRAIRLNSPTIENTLRFGIYLFMICLQIYFS